MSVEFAVLRNPHAPCSLARTGGHGTVRSVREILILAIHLLVTLAKLVRPGDGRPIPRPSIASSSASPRRRPGPKGPSAELIAAIVALKGRNPHFGCVRIAQQITRAFSVEIDKDVVRRVLARHYRPGDSDTTGPSWLTFIAQAKDSLWSVDLFRCESILLHSHWVLLVIDVFTRRIVGFGIERGSIDGLSVCRMFNHAVTDWPPPKCLSNDHNPLLRFHRWRANLRVRGIEEIKSVPYAPASHPFVERLIGTIRREYLDHVFFWNAADLARKLEAFRDYYNGHRVHRAIAGLMPAQRAGALRPAPAALDHYGWQRHCRGLFELPIAA